jgi:hypothetical protein
MERPPSQYPIEPYYYGGNTVIGPPPPPQNTSPPQYPVQPYSFGGNTVIGPPPQPILNPTLAPQDTTIEPKKRWFTTMPSSYTTKIVLTVLHGITAILILAFLFACNTTQFNRYMYSMEAFDFNTYKNSPWNQYTCNTSVACFREGIPWDDQYRPVNFYWNSYVLLFVFEWITTAFCLFYLRHVPNYTNNQEKQNKGMFAFKIASLCVLFVGVIIYITYFAYYKQSNWLEFIAVAFSFTLSALVFFIFDVQITKWLSIIPSERHALVNMNGRTWKIHPKFLSNDENEEDTSEKQHDMSLRDEMQLRMEVVLRYLEYTCTAPLLYLALLCIMTVGTPYWAALGGYVCIFASCMYGIPLHIMHVFEKTMIRLKKMLHPDVEGETDPLVGKQAMKQGKKPIILTQIYPWQALEASSKEAWKIGQLQYVSEYNNKLNKEKDSVLHHFLWGWLFMGKYRSTWAAKLQYLQISWIHLVMALTIVIYLGRTLLTNSFLPMYVNASLWILFILYSSFGIAATLFYLVLNDSLWKHMDMVLDILSFMAKVPIVFILAVGYINMPGNTCTK